MWCLCLDVEETGFAQIPIVTTSASFSPLIDLSSMGDGGFLIHICIHLSTDQFLIEL